MRSGFDRPSLQMYWARGQPLGSGDAEHGRRRPSTALAFAGPHFGDVDLGRGSDRQRPKGEPSASRASLQRRPGWLIALLIEQTRDHGLCGPRCRDEWGRQRSRADEHGGNRPAPPASAVGRRRSSPPARARVVERGSAGLIGVSATEVPCSMSALLSGRCRNAEPGPLRLLTPLSRTGVTTQKGGTAERHDHSGQVQPIRAARHHLRSGGGHLERGQLKRCDERHDGPRALGGDRVEVARPAGRGSKRLDLAGAGDDAAAA